MTIVCRQPSRAATVAGCRPAGSSDDDQFVVRPRRELPDAAHAGGEQVELARAFPSQLPGRGDDNRDERRVTNGALDAEHAGCGSRQHLRAQVVALHVVFEREPAGVHGPWLGKPGARRGFGQLAPVVQDPRDVMDAARALHQPEHQVVVLSALITTAESADVLEQRPAHHHQMARVHAREEVIGRPVRFEIRIASRPGEIELVLVGVDQVRRGFVVEEPGHVKECVGRQLVVMIEKRNEVAGSYLQGGVAGCRNVRVLLEVDDRDPGIILVLAQYRQRCR